MKRLSAIIFTVAIGLLLTPGCQKQNPIWCTPTFQLDLFEENLEDALAGNVMGYAYVVTDGGTVVLSNTGGQAQSGADGDVDMSLNRQMHIASISKFVTTIAAVQVCNLKQVPLDTEIGPYLPSGWSRGPGINNVTIAELIAHTAGMNQVGTQRFSATVLDSLQAYVAAGATGPKTGSYSNSHCGLLRVVLSRLWDKYRPSDGNYDAEHFSNVYKSCVQQLVFDKINITGDFSYSNGNQILAYNGPNDNGTGGGGFTDFSMVAGGMGWHMSSWDMAKLWAHAWFTNDFLAEDEKDWLKANQAGLWNTLDGDRGTYYCKLGGWNYSGGTPSKSMNSVVMLFPNDIQLTLFINSPVPAGFSSLRVLARDCFDDAYGC